MGSKRSCGISASDVVPEKSAGIETPNPTLVELQLALYTFEAFFRGPFWGHVVYGTVMGPMLELWYYDRAGVVGSGKVDFVKDLEVLGRFLKRIACLSETSWGLHPIITYPSSAFIR